MKYLLLSISIYTSISLNAAEEFHTRDQIRLIVRVTMLEGEERENRMRIKNQFDTLEEMSYWIKAIFTDINVPLDKIDAVYFKDKNSTEVPKLTFGNYPELYRHPRCCNNLFYSDYIEDLYEKLGELHIKQVELNPDQKPNWAILTKILYLNPKSNTHVLYDWLKKQDPEKENIIAHMNYDDREYIKRLIARQLVKTTLKKKICDGINNHILSYLNNRPFKDNEEILPIINFTRKNYNNPKYLQELPNHDSNIKEYREFHAKREYIKTIKQIYLPPLLGEKALQN